MPVDGSDGRLGRCWTAGSPSATPQNSAISDGLDGLDGFLSFPKKGFQAVASVVGVPHQKKEGAGYGDGSKGGARHPAGQ